MNKYSYNWVLFDANGALGRWNAALDAVCERVSVVVFPPHTDEV